MKVVVDANIIISGLRFGGKPRSILELANRGDLEGFTSNEAMDEVEATLMKKFGVLTPEWLVIAEALRDSLTVIPTQKLLSVPKLRDKRDLHILAAATHCLADCIVSGDKDLLVLGEYKNIQIMKVNDFFEQYHP
ncbi:MAG: putative toxin-antitoxin system toxin component, PIN family [bacterium]|nr:putative toxin-antitoxin system toxin component, PIN family [bacterium]